MKKLAVAAILAFALTGCGTHVVPGATSAASLAAEAQAKKKTSSKRPAPPTAKKTSTRQGFAASQAAQYCATALAQYQTLQYQWNAAYSDYDKDQIETQMLNVLHQALNNVQSVTSAQGVDATDRRSYDMADQALNRYDSSYSQWQRTYDDYSKRVIVNQMLSDLVGALQQIQTNY